jgi:hypothetical protein
MRVRIGFFERGDDFCQSLGQGLDGFTGHGG